MIRNLLRKLTGRQTMVTAKVYLEDLNRYRRAHPESLEKEREQIQRWLTYVKSRPEQETNNERTQEVKTTDARAQLREVAPGTTFPKSLKGRSSRSSQAVLN